MFSSIKRKFLTITFCAGTLQSHPYDAIINLGGDCQPAYQLTLHKLRLYALPFDALITPFASLYHILENRFEDFLNSENFELIVQEDGIKYIRDKKYDTRLIHDFKLQEDFIKDYPEIAAKYLRRISRLLDRIVTSDYPLFIRKRITKEQAHALQELLFTMREGRPYMLLVLQSTQEPDWHLEYVRNFYLRQPEPYTWKGDDAAWQEIFQALGLLASQEEAS